MDFGRQCEKFFRRMLMTLQFAEQQAELLGEARQPGGGPVDFQHFLFLRQQRAQHHYAAFLIQNSLRNCYGLERVSDRKFALRGLSFRAGEARRGQLPERELALRVRMLARLFGGEGAGSVRSHRYRRWRELGQDKLGESLEGQNLQPSVARQIGSGQ